MKDREGPERRCIATGESGPAAGLIRFVVGPDATIVPDLAGRLPGRGIWVSAARAALERAERKNLFSRAARTQVRVPEGLAGLVERLAAQRSIELLALARKAGLAIAGHDRVKARLKQGPVAVLIEAADGSEQGRARLRPLAGDARRITCLTGAELGLAFGRDSVIHAALEAGGITDRFIREADRLQGLRRETWPSGPMLHEE
ncbi:MAG TPA: RNA-binding protein [Paracoccaceae bacterium]|nr:RNA-binding protein [Paracoccaceae bacterium]